jgi:aspartyl-tRNA(Asn)/glutamyl-tRNA(Gln) amidotransferase subunit A
VRRWPAEALGATLVEVSLPRTELSIPVYYIAPAEASSNLSLRRRQVRPPRGELHRSAGHVQEDPRRRLRPRGQAPHHDRHLCARHGYYDAYYLQAKLRRMIADDFQRCFQQCDVIAGPVAPTVAWQIGAQGDDPLQAYLADIFTLPAWPACPA